MEYCFKCHSLLVFLENISKKEDIIENLYKCPRCEFKIVDWSKKGDKKRYENKIIGLILRDMEDGDNIEFIRNKWEDNYRDNEEAYK